MKIFGRKNIKFYGSEELTILNPSKLPDPKIITEYHEPMVLGTIIAPDDYVGEMLALIMDRRGEHKDQTYIDDTRIMFKVLFPLADIIVDFFDELKSLTSVYERLDYEDS